MARDVHHVVDTAEEPEVAVLVDARAVAREVHLLVLRPVRLAEALIVAEDAAQHRRPRALQHEIAAAARTDLVPPFVEDAGLDTRERLCRGSRLERRDARERSDHHHAGFRLPPRVAHGSAVTAYVLAIPDPGLRIDRLADRPEQPQRRQIVLLRVLGPPLHVR